MVNLGRCFSWKHNSQETGYFDHMTLVVFWKMEVFSRIKTQHQNLLQRLFTINYGSRVNVGSGLIFLG